MFAVALIGPDGAGKSTLARCLETSLPFPARAIYMGINMDSSNVAFPVARWIARSKKARRQAHTAGSSASRRWMRPWLRLANRLTDHWYRHAVAWLYRRLGYVVIYDRCFRYDFYSAPDELRRLPLPERLKRWCFLRTSPQPDLVICLDAPAEVLYRRKQEWSIERLEQKRQSLLRQRSLHPHFILVNADQPLDELLAEVAGHITRFHRQRKPPYQSDQMGVLRTNDASD